MNNINTNEPLGVVNSFIDKNVKIVMKDNIQFSGKLIGFDEYMHFILEDVKETKQNDESFTRSMSRILLNGNGIEYVSKLLF